MLFKIEIDDKDKKPLYMQIYEQLREQIRSGNFPSDTKLPPIRSLANKSRINAATVVKAYDLLARDGLVYKITGSGCFIAPYVNENEVNGGNLQEQRKNIDMLFAGQVQLNEMINFASAIPSPTLFPVKEFGEAINQVLARDGGEAFSYEKTQGYYPLREAIWSKLATQDIQVDMENVQVISGAQQGIDLLSKTILNSGDRVVVESPTYSGALSAFRLRKVDIRHIPVKEDGLNMEALEELLSRETVRCVYVMSAFQNPTGICWSDVKKKRLLHLANQHDFYIIEDDCLSELYYSGEQPPPLKALDRDERVVYIKSFSKTIMPGLRLAYMILPTRLIEPILGAKHGTDISSAGLTQRAFEICLRQGVWDEHVRKMRLLYSKKQELMYKLITRCFPVEIAMFAKPRGGLYFWLSLPKSLDSLVFYEEALKSGVSFLPGSVFGRGEQSSWFRLSFVAVGESEMERGMKILQTVSNRLLHISDQNQGFSPIL